MWNIKTKVISVATWATRTISKQFEKYLNITPGRPDGYQGTTQNSHTGRCATAAGRININVHKRSTWKRALHNDWKTTDPRNMVCSRFVILNNLHGGDDYY
jgi:hypothetical protein